MQRGFGHANHRDRQNLARSRKGGIERNRQDRRIVTGMVGGQGVKHCMCGNIVLRLAGDDADTKPGRGAGDFRSRGGAPPGFGENTIGNGLSRITVYEEQLHFPRGVAVQTKGAGLRT